MYKKIQRAAALFLSVLMMMTVLSVQGTAAGGDTVTETGVSYENYMKIGLQDISATEISEEESNEIKAAIAHDYGKPYIEGSKTVIIPNKYSGSHSVYATDYFYDQMNSAEKQLYDALYNAFSSFMTSDVELSTVNFTDAVQYNAGLISDERLNVIYYVFYYSNPQFYFVGNGYKYYPGGGMVYPGIDDAFKSSSTRKAYSTAINSITNSWLAEIRRADTQFERQCIIFRKLSEHITYGYSDHHQTIAGAFVEKECVCNGYAMATEYLCNAVGIDCLIAVSGSHAWNIVKINGVWYEFDVTWIDLTDYGYLDLKWLNKSHDTFLKNDESDSHVYNTTTYPGFSLPACSVDMKTVYDDYSVYNRGITKYTGSDTEVKIPTGLYATSIGSGAFYENETITSVVIPEGYTGIGSYAFYCCTSLTDIYIPDSVTSIGSGALYGCEMLKTIDIPSSVTTIGSSAFLNTGLTTINFAGSESEWEQLNVSDLPSGCTVLFADKTNASANFGSASYSVAGDITDYLNSSDKTAGQYALVVEEKSVDSTLTSAVSSTMSARSVAAAKFEISLEKYSNNVPAGSIGETAKPITVTVDLPSDIIKTGDGDVRDYTLVRIDGNDIERIDTNSDGTSLTFPVSKFGDYAIVYTDLAYGDVNGDGTVNMADLLLLKQYMVKVPEKIVFKASADVNADNSLNMADLLRMKQYMVKVPGVTLGKVA